MAFVFCGIMKKSKPTTFSDKPDTSRKEWKSNLNIIFLHVIISAIVFAAQTESVDGKVLSSQKYYVNKRTGEEDSGNVNFQDYYEDSFEDHLTHNFVEEYETDGEVRITEDDVEESYKDEGEEFPSRGARVVHLDPRCPDLPQPSKLTKNLCSAKSCLNDDDCQNKSNPQPPYTLVCCFNGCVHSCLPRVDPPKAFDWLEDTEMIQHVHNTNGTMDNNDGSSTLNSKALFTDEITASKISLPGGCYITQQQLQELRLFRKYDHVEVCTCLNGEVVCQINPRVALKTDELQGSRLPI